MRTTEAFGSADVDERQVAHRLRVFIVLSSPKEWGMVTSTGPLIPAKVGDFYVWVAAAIALFAFAAFAPTYWLQLPAGTFVGTPLIQRRRR